MSDTSQHTDQRIMAAAIRLARRNEGQTGTNPSVACVLVRESSDGSYIVGSGITALGGRPHAEPIALAEAGELARGATAYVTLEPCAHHGKTPPCAQTLIDAGIARVVTAVVDPDERVNQLGHKMLRDSGIDVTIDCLADEATIGLRAYLNRKHNNRCYVTLKLALSAEGAIGIKGEGQVAITGPQAKNQTYLLRARHQAILVGAGTVAEDDPELTCRLHGLESRSPIRIVLDPYGRTPLTSKLYSQAKTHRTIIIAADGMSEVKRQAFRELGCEIFPCEMQNGQVALPELLEDLSGIGILSVLVEGGAGIAKSFLDEALVDEIILLESPKSIAAAKGDLVLAPISSNTIPKDFTPLEVLALGEDKSTRYIWTKSN
ncbi:MAG: bifunctional diaminohydroxyphosphoribosylaminopyrimidine deaminase/5-amino-6-(5-phosphoribosylamino)uracil reductase RibD [Salaquimonas sp.]